MMQARIELLYCKIRFSKIFLGQFLIAFSLFTFQVLATMGQSNLPATIAQSFTDHASQVLQEKIFVHTDKSFYIAGEIIWFKLYNVDGYFLEPLTIHKLAYVEILSRDQKPVLQAKIELTTGSGIGSFMIPASIQSGNYLLRAYTNWMKNFAPEFYFEKTFTIVNPSKKPEWPAEENSPKYDIQFFPEGGNLVYGIASKVAFRAVDQNGKGVECKGVVLNKNNDTIARFQSLRFGMGHFLITPARADHYVVHIKMGDSLSLTAQLPQVYEQGYVMHVLDSANQLQIDVYTNDVSSQKEVYLFAHTRHLAKASQMLEFNKGKAAFVLPKKLLGEGISHLTIFNYARQPVCERLYFKRPEQRLIIEMKADQDEYAPRQMVNLGILTLDPEKIVTTADLSMSVFLIDSLQPLEQTNALNYLYLSSDLKTSIESPDYYFGNTAEVDKAADNLMLCHGWRRFRWEDILQNKESAFEFLPEYEGHIVNGRIIDKGSGLSAGNISAFLSVPGEKFQLSNSLSNQNGQIRFVVKNFYGTEEIVIQTNNQKDSIYRIEIVNPFSEKFSSTSLPHFSLSQKRKDDLASHSLSAQVQNAYWREKNHQFYLSTFTDTTSFYGIPDKKYFLDDYTRFVTMEEVMREYVAEVRVKKQREKFHYEVQNSPYKLFFDKDPLVLLDGVPVFDINKILAFDPLKVKKLEVVTRKHYFGKLANEGIVSYFTYQGDLGGFEMDPNALILEYEGFQLQREFFSPVYETAQQSNSRLPDFRNVLLWSPDIQTDENGKYQLGFYTSDVPGKYAVVVQGITPKGLVGNKLVTFTVSK